MKKENIETKELYLMDSFDKDHIVAESLLLIGLINTLEPYIDGSVKDLSEPYYEIAKQSNVYVNGGYKIKSTLRMNSREKLNLDEIALSSGGDSYDGSYTGYNMYPNNKNHVAFEVTLSKDIYELLKIKLEKSTEEYVDDASSLEEKKAFIIDVLMNKKKRSLLSFPSDKKIGLSEDTVLALYGLKNRMASWLDSQVREEKQKEKPNVLKKENK